MHLASDSRCRPLAFILTPSQAGDAPAFPQVMARLRVPRPVGRPRTTPVMVLADKAYSSRAIRAQQAEAVAWPGHPLRQDRHHLPRRTPPRSHLHLVGQMIRRKRPSRTGHTRKRGRDVPKGMGPCRDGALFLSGRWRLPVPLYPRSLRRGTGSALHRDRPQVHRL
ncbi:transposase [Streptomyces sp. NPDC005506]|uniref:transposase n=1 Tax=Streptomyces sp. NPDC005506 TaxID=3364718 RepID=UPI0036A479D5